MNSPVDAAASQEISILIVIDTEYVKAHYPNPSQDPNHPTGIDHNSQFMLCTGSRGAVTGQGTADMKFVANPGDYAAFYGTSIYDNSDDAVIVYGIKHWSGDNVFNQFVPNVVTRTGAVIPDPNTPAGIPPKHVQLSFSSLGSMVSNKGTEKFYVFFALYTLASDGETQNLFGYYHWDPSIQVS